MSDYGLDEHVQFPAGAKDFSSLTSFPADGDRINGTHGQK
jgi:hypothetical protein